MKFYNAVLMFACLGFYVNASAYDFYVSPTGSDLANGLAAQTNRLGTAGPFKTLTAAQQAVRNLLAGGAYTGPVTVHVAAGVYRLTAPLYFQGQDSGVGGNRVVWQGVQGQTFIYGGVALPNCAAAANGFWSCPVGNSGLGNIPYNANSRKKGNIPGFNLFVNQQRYNLARWPDSGWAHIKIPLDASTSFTTFEQLPNFSGDLSGAQVHIFAGNDWYDEFLPVASISSAGNSISLAANTAYPLASGRRFYLQNISSALNAPMEWWFDSVNAQVVFIPAVNTQPSTVVASVLPNLLIINGASNLTFQNMVFQYSTDVAISIDNSSFVTLYRLEIAHVDTTAVQVVNSNNVLLTHNVIHDTGEEGVYLAAGDRASLQSAQNSVISNHFYNFGAILLTYTPAVDTNGVGSRILNNVIEQGPGAGVLLTGNNHLFQKNEVSNVCQQASDCGALYSGRDWAARGNSVLNNSFHDIYGYGLQNVDVANNIVTYSSPNGARGVYLDDAFSSFLIKGNIFINAGLMSIQLGGGRNNDIINNVFETNHYAIYTDNRWPGYDWSMNFASLAAVPYLSPVWKAEYPALALPMAHYYWPEGNTISHNVIVSTSPDGLALNYMLPNQTTTINNNLVWNANGKFGVSYVILDMSNLTGLSNWQGWTNLGIEKNSIYADPCATITTTSVTFCANSPVLGIGFQPLAGGIGLIQ